MPAQVVATLPRAWLLPFVLVAFVLVAPADMAAQQASSGQIQVLPVRGNIYVLQGAGANITVSVGRDGVLMVDSGLASMGEQVLAAIRRLQNQLDLRDKPPGFGAETRSSVADRNVETPAKPIRYIINTHVHPDHVGGNELLRRSGMTFTGGNVAGNISDAGEGAAIMAHEAVLVRMTSTAGGATPAPADAQPTDTYYTDTMKLSHFFNGEGVQLIHQPSAHTDGDTMVWFRGSDVIAAGDVFSTTSYPIVDVKQGGSINGVVEGLNRILRYCIAEFRTEGGTLVVPGHGRLSDSADVAYYRDMVTIIRDRVSAMVAKGLTLEQVKAAKPTADYDPRYGATSGAWTTDQFIEAAYVSLGGGKSGSAQDRAGAIEVTSCGRTSAMWIGIVVACLATMAPIAAQRGEGRQGGAPSARAAAPVDLTGLWVSIVTEDWRWRMRTPPKGDYASLPLTDAAIKAADSWDPARDAAAGEQCRPFGGAAIMRVPGRIRVSWNDDTTLKVETEAGTQTRSFVFGSVQPGEPSWQGVSVANWQAAGGAARRGGGPPRGGSLRVVTTNLRPGYLRRNGVPYSANARVTEYFNRVNESNGDSWLIVTTMVEDPQYLNARFVTSSHFKKIPDDSAWKPTPCE